MEHKGPPIFKAWLIFIVISSVLGVLAGAAAGFVVGFTLGLLGHVDLDSIRLACGAAGFITGLPVSFFVFQWVVNRFVAPNVWPPALAHEQNPVR